MSQIRNKSLEIMKILNPTLLLTLMFLFLSSANFYAQRGHHGKHPYRARTAVVVKSHPRPGKVVIVKSKYRPAKMVVYHPYWGPKYQFHRRWVYFPRHNFYWDNWRQCYFFWNGVIWINQVTPPPIVVNIESEKHYELQENEDDIDDVYQTNDSHKSQFKGDTLK